MCVSGTDQQMQVDLQWHTTAQPPGVMAHPCHCQRISASKHHINCHNGALETWYWIFYGRLHLPLFHFCCQLRVASCSQTCQEVCEKHNRKRRPTQAPTHPYTCPYMHNNAGSSINKALSNEQPPTHATAYASSLLFRWAPFINSCILLVLCASVEKMLDCVYGCAHNVN